MPLPNRHVEEKIEEKLSELRALLAPNAEQIADVLSRLMTWTPEDGASVLRATVKVHGYPYDPDDAKQPFFSEAFLYPLLGKEDARTLLGRLGALCDALGFDRQARRERGWL